MIKSTNFAKTKHAIYPKLLPSYCTPEITRKSGAARNHSCQVPL